MKIKPKYALGCIVAFCLCLALGIITYFFVIKSFSVSALSNDVYDTDKLFVYESDLDIDYSESHFVLNKLLLLDDICRYNDLTPKQELVYLHGLRYNDEYWNFFVGEDDENVNSIIDDCNPVLCDLRDEQIIYVPNTSHQIKLAHTMGSIDCLASGLDSVGTWQGDIIELSNEIASEDANYNYEDAYLRAVELVNTDVSSCGIIDISSDIIATNIASYMIDDVYIGAAMTEFFDYAGYFNQYALFLKNEFDIQSDVTEDEFKTIVTDAFRGNIFTQAFYAQQDCQNPDILQASLDAFSEYVYAGLDGKSVDDLLKHSDKFESESIYHRLKIVRTLKRYKLYYDYLISKF